MKVGSESSVKGSRAQGWGEKVDCIDEYWWKGRMSTDFSAYKCVCPGWVDKF